MEAYTIQKWVAFECFILLLYVKFIFQKRFPKVFCKILFVAHFISCQNSWTSPFPDYWRVVRLIQLSASLPIATPAQVFEISLMRRFCHDITITCTKLYYRENPTKRHQRKRHISTSRNDNPILKKVPESTFKPIF